MTTPRTIKVETLKSLLWIRPARRRDPDAAPLPEYRELRIIRVARWPAGPRSARLRRTLARPLDGLAAILRSLAERVNRAAAFVEGQPIVQDVLKSDWYADYNKMEVRQIGSDWRTRLEAQDDEASR